MAEEQKIVQKAASCEGAAPVKDAPRGAKTQGKFERVAKDAKRDRRPRRGDNRKRRDEGPKEFEEVTVAVNRVARVVKGGRRFRFQALMVLGDRKNRVGVGLAKGEDVQAAVTKATAIAKKNMTTFSLSGTTIPHEVEVKVTGAHAIFA
jgi:ribosomal protein S5